MSSGPRKIPPAAMPGMNVCIPQATPISPAMGAGRPATAPGLHDLPGGTAARTLRAGGAASAVTTPTLRTARAVASSGVIVWSPMTTVRS